MPDKDNTFQTIENYMSEIAKNYHKPTNLHDMAKNLSKLTIGNSHNNWADKIIQNLKYEECTAHHTINETDNKRPFTIYFSKQGQEHKIHVGYTGQFPLTEVMISLDGIPFDPLAINSAIYDAIRS